MVKIHKSANIHSTVVLDGNIEIGANTRIGPYSVILGDVKIGSDNNICSHVVIGEGPEHRKNPEGIGFINIGNNNTIRELTVIQRGTGDCETSIGDNCYLMDHCHIAHDALIENDVTIAPNTVLAGHVRIQEGATVGINVAIHQFTTIGSYSMIGMATVVTKDIFPFVVVSGIPVRYQRLNAHHFPKFSITEANFFNENGRLKSDHLSIKRYFENFYSNSRRGKFLLLSDEVSAT